MSEGKGKAGYSIFTDLADRLQAFILERQRGNISEKFPEFENIIQSQHAYNSWFTEAFVIKSIDLAVCWLRDMDFKQNAGVSANSKPKTIAVLPAQNLPLSGFLEIMTILASGNSVVLKKGGNERELLQYVTTHIVQVNKEPEDNIQWVDHFPKSVDGWLILSKPENSVLQQYFQTRKHLIYPKQISVAILTGNETDEDLRRLADDIFIFWGFAPGNVRKIYVPAGYNFNRFFEALEPFAYVYRNNRYANNYDYHKSIFLMDSKPFLDNGFVALYESRSFNVPMGCLTFEYFKDSRYAKQEIEANINHIYQCVSNLPEIPLRVGFGESYSVFLNANISSQLFQFLNTL